ncbi:hypothetical protein GQ457_03G015920 [Hibiscus cannabinus]
MSATHVKNQAEAVATREVGDKLGVIFESADEVVVDPLLEASGGLISMWKSGFFSLESSDFYQAIVLVDTLLSVKSKCGLVNIYATNDPMEKGFLFFYFLSATLSSLHIPLIVRGDFNTVKCGEEKVGASVDERSIRTFINFIQVNALVDLAMGRKFYTWFRSEPFITACLLDMFLVSPKILSWFPDLSQCALQRKLSDHCPVVMRDYRLERKGKTFKWFSH